MTYEIFNGDTLTHDIGKVTGKERVTPTHKFSLIIKLWYAERLKEVSERIPGQIIWQKRCQRILDLIWLATFLFGKAWIALVKAYVQILVGSVIVFYFHDAMLHSARLKRTFLFLPLFIFTRNTMARARLWFTRIPRIPGAQVYLALRLQYSIRQQNEVYVNICIFSRVYITHSGYKCEVQCISKNDTLNFFERVTANI